LSFPDPLKRESTMTAIPSTVKYKWTGMDGIHAQNGGAVTPYVLHWSLVPGSATLTGGTVIPALPIKLAEKYPAVKRFELGHGFGWEAVPPGVEDAETLAELCDKLWATRNPKYVEGYYNRARMSAADRNKTAMLIFDYWENTEYRYAVITGGGFDWNLVNPDKTPDIMWSLRAKAMSKEKGEPAGLVRRVRFVPVRLPETSVISAKPGSESIKVVAPDPVLALLDMDVAEIRSLTNRIADLFEKSKKDLEDRTRFAHGYTALRVLLEQCAGSSQEALHVTRVAATARKLEARVHREIPKFKLREQLALASRKASSLSYLQAETRLSEVIRSELGYVDDMAAEIQKLTDRLCELLVGEGAAAARCGELARKVIERKLHGSPAFEAVRAKIAASVADALAILHEARTSAEFAKKIAEAIQFAPEKPILKASDVRDRSFLDATFGFVGAQKWALGGFVASTVTTAVGNLAGPPSLYIAAVQLNTWFKLQTALSKGAMLADAEASALLTEIVTEMEKGLPPTSAVRIGLREAVMARSQEKLLKIKRDFLDELTGRRQATPSWKGGMLFFQVVSIFIGIRNMHQDVKDKKGAIIIFADLLGLEGQASSMGVGIMDVALTTDVGKTALRWAAVKMPWLKLAGAVQDIDGQIAKLGLVGMRVGRVCAFIGVIVSVIQATDAGYNRDYPGLAIATVSFGANVAMVYACSQWLLGTPVPQLQAAALALSLLAMGAVIIKAAAESSTPKPNLVAEALLRMIDDSPYGIALRNDAEYVDLLAKVKAVCVHKLTESTTVLPRPRNNSFVVDALRMAGFSHEHIALIVEDIGAPIVPGAAATVGP